MPRKRKQTASSDQEQAAKPKRGRSRATKGKASSNGGNVSVVPGALCADGPVLHRFFDVVQFVLRMVDERGWRCGVKRFMRDRAAFLEYLGMMGTELEKDGLVPALTVHGHTRSRRPCTVLFGSPGGSASFNKDAAVKACQRLPEKTHALILVLPGKPTIMARKIVQARVPRVWMFNHLQCWSDHMRNVGVPQHRRLEGDERAAVVARFKPSQLPRIHQSEAVARYYGWAPGTIVEVRQCQDVGVVLNYRQVDPV